MRPSIAANWNRESDQEKKMRTALPLVRLTGSVRDLCGPVERIEQRGVALVASDESLDTGSVEAGW